MPEMTPDQIAALRRLADDLERILAGHAPTAADLADAPLLDPWMATFEFVPVLAGRVTGHPVLGDRGMQTSPIFALDPHRCWARTATRFYRLGRQDGETGGHA
jgi:hypothetical protein